MTCSSPSGEPAGAGGARSLRRRGPALRGRRPRCAAAVLSVALPGPRRHLATPAGGARGLLHPAGRLRPDAHEPREEGTTPARGRLLRATARRLPRPALRVRAGAGDRATRRRGRRASPTRRRPARGGRAQRESAGPRAAPARARLCARRLPCSAASHCQVTLLSKILKVDGARGELISLSAVAKRDCTEWNPRR